MSTIKVNNIQSRTGNAISFTSGDTITIPSGATFTNNGTLTGFPNNTPSFYAYLGGNISNFVANQYNTIVFGTEGHDSNSDYDTSTGIFTPSVAGKYFCFAAAKMGNFGDGAGSKFVTLAFFWNGTSTQAGHTNIEANGETTVTVANVIQFNGTTDNIRVRGYQNDGAGTRFVVGGSGNGTAGNYTWFGAYRIVGA